MKRLIILLLSLATVPCFATDIGGVINTNSTLTYSNSPYTVTSNLLVAAGARLTIEPGVVIKFNNNIYMKVLGELQALGKADSMIQINRSSNVNQPSYEGWHGISVASSAPDYDSASGAGTILSYVEFGGFREYQSPNNSLIRADSINILISHCTFRNGDAGSAITLYNGQSIVRNSQFLNTEGAPTPYGKFYIMLYTYNDDSTERATIKDNEFVNYPSIETGFVEVINAVCTGNLFRNSRKALRLIGPCIVTNNLFLDGEIGIEIREVPIGKPWGLTQIIRCNVFRNTGTCLLVSGCKAKPVFENNYMMVASPNKIFFAGGCPNTGVPEAINFANNYWGTTDSAAIEAMIRDFDADFSAVKQVGFMPVLTDSNPVCPEPEDTTTTGVKDINIAGGSIQVFPNPFANNCTVSINAELLSRYDDLNISVYNLLGQEIYMIPLNRKEVTIDGSALGNSKGVLFYMVRTKGVVVHSGKLVAR